MWNGGIVEWDLISNSVCLPNCLCLLPTPLRTFFITHHCLWPLPCYLIGKNLPRFVKKTDGSELNHIISLMVGLITLFSVHLLEVANMKNRILQQLIASLASGSFGERMLPGTSD